MKYYDYDDPARHLTARRTLYAGWGLVAPQIYGAHLVDSQFNFSGAICSAIDPELFFPERRNSKLREAKQAKALCGKCLVRHECLRAALAFALSDGEHPAGIWGGKDRRERMMMLKLVAA